jgi:hypothetical protein
VAIGGIRVKSFVLFGGDASSGLRYAGPSRFPQKWQTNSNNSQARAWVPH